MMRFGNIILLAILPRLSSAKTCHAISPAVTDAWCNKNCNNQPPNCPASDCSCDTPGPTPGPTPSPPTPGPTPGPSPTPTPTPSPLPPSGFNGSIFELDLFVNDKDAGWQATGFPDYLQHSAAKYMNVAGVSFIQPANLMNDTYDLPPKVASAVQVLRKQGVFVQLLMGGEFSDGWPALEANPAKAAANALKLMKKHDCGIEVDDETGGAAAGVITFMQLIHKSKPKTTHVSICVAGTPTATQKQIVQGAMSSIDWVNMMVSAPQYDQTNSVNFGHADGIPYSKIVIAYYAGTWVDNCNSIGSVGNNGDTAAGLAIRKKFGLRGLSIWSVGGASYANCKTTDAPGFSDAMSKLAAHTQFSQPTEASRIVV